MQLAEALAGTAQRLVDDAVDLAGRARPAVEQAADLGEQLVDPAAALVPVVREQAPAVAGMLPDLVQALGDLLQDLPELLRRIDQDVLPTLRSLRTTPGDVRALRDTVADIEPLVGDVEAELAGLPGSGLLRRRGRKADAPTPRPLRRPPRSSSLRGLASVAQWTERLRPKEGVGSSILSGGTRHDAQEPGPRGDRAPACERGD